MKKTTMKDIAIRANVSVATVSYVLNRVDNQTIPEKTRRQIMELAKELRYIPNLAARSLANQKTGLIGVLVHKSKSLPYWKLHAQLAFIHALEQRLTAAGYHTLLYSLDTDTPSLDIIVERKLEAVFLIDAQDHSFYSISRHFVEGIPLTSMIVLRLVRSANVPPIDPSSELSNRLMIVSTATSLALPVV